MRKSDDDTFALAFGHDEWFERQLQADEIVGPLVSLVEINDQRMRDQQMLLESFELELRTLKLQCESLREEESVRSVRLEIERLAEKLVALK